MKLYAIGDLHLSFQVPDHSQDFWGGVWVNHEKKILKNFQVVKPEDTLVLVGDHSWGKNLSSCRLDLEFIENLPGRKILTRGNHDMFWDSNKTEKLNEIFTGKLEFLQGNFYSFGEYALVGTKGYTYEGRDTPEHAAKLVDREAKRLRTSFESARSAGYSKYVMFLHYPPTNIMEKESVFTKMAEEYHVSAVVYAHCHGENRFHDSIQGIFHGIPYYLVSGDYLDFHPKRIL